MSFLKIFLNNFLLLVCFIYTQNILADEKITNSEIDKKLTEYYLSRIDKEYTGYVENYSLRMFNNKFLFKGGVDCFFILIKESFLVILSVIIKKT